MKIVVGHPGKQHSYHTAVAIKHAGHLFKYLTTCYSFKEDNNLLSKISKRFSERRCKELNDSDVLTFGRHLFFLSSFLIRVNKMAYRWANGLISDYFGRRVATYCIKNQVDAVVMFDTSCEKCFSILERKAPETLRIQDVAAINRIYMADVYSEEVKRSPEHRRDILRERGFVFNKRNQHRWKREIDLTDYFIVPSMIVEKSLIFSGANKDRIFTCPYGSNFGKQKRKNIFFKGNKLNILYVGSVTQMKGISYLLDAYLELPKEQYTLTAVGDIQASSARDKACEDCVLFIGRVPHEELVQYYENCDVFVFPSLGDSFGLVVLEAMGFGLPVICSDHAGASDVITDGENGYIVPVGDKEAIKKKLKHLYEHKDLLKAMSEKAQETADKYSWGNYEKAIADAITEIFSYEAK